MRLGFVFYYLDSYLVHCRGDEHLYTMRDPQSTLRDLWIMQAETHCLSTTSTGYEGISTV